VRVRIVLCEVGCDGLFWWCADACDAAVSEEEDAGFCLEVASLVGDGFSAFFSDVFNVVSEFGEGDKVCSDAFYGLGAHGLC